MYKWIVLSLVLLSGCAGTSMTTEQAQNSARIHTELAGIYFERAQMGVALGEIDKALESKSNYAPAYNVRALIHMALLEDKEAEQDFKHSLSLDRENSETNSNYGWYLCQRGQEKSSIRYFLAALKNPLYQSPEQAFLNAAVCSQKIGDNVVAEDFYKRALVVQPDLPQALLGMAQLYFAKEEYGVAKKYFNQYVSKHDNLSAADLWLGVRISRESNDRNAVASYSMKLRNNYPDSKEARLLNPN